MKQFIYAAFLAVFFILFSLSSHAEIPKKVFAPYIDVTLSGVPSMMDIYNATGQKYFTLAFVLESYSNDCQPSWGPGFYKSQIDALRAVGGDVIISFGGANGTELAMGCTDEVKLLQAYQKIIDDYDLKWIDFDIEGGAVSDVPSIERRSRVIKQLQDNNPDLVIAFCLPVFPSGLTSTGLYVIQSAVNEGVRIDVVNVMAMDYGDANAPDPEGKMGQYAIDAGQNTHDQMINMGVDTTIGVTPMIGLNDVTTERFYVNDGAKLVNWANQMPWVSMLSIWSGARDNGNCPGRVSPVCSGINQSPYDFTNTFTEFYDGWNGNYWPTVSINPSLNGQSFADGVPVTIAAVADDSDGSVLKVEFFSGTKLIGTDTISPYSMVWRNVPSGVHHLIAVVTDNDGAEVPSTPVKIYVGEAVCVGQPWNSSIVYVGGNKVSHGFKEWEAKWWTQGNEPGNSIEWKEIGDCTFAATNQTPPLSWLLLYL